MVDGGSPSSYSERPDSTTREDFRRRFNLASDLHDSKTEKKPGLLP